MKRRALTGFWLLLMVAAGFFAGAFYDQSRLWKGDMELVDRFDIRPRALDLVDTQDQSESQAQLDSQSRPPEESPAISFDELTNHGVDFRYTNGPDDLFHLADTLGGGVAAVDIDLDSRTDLVFVDGGNPIEPDLSERGDISSYRHGTDLKFQETATVANLHWSGYGHGCSVNDFNEDGFPDLLITGFSGCQLFKNQGDGTYTKIVGLGSIAADKWCATAAWGDLDSDGDQDVYITCYTDTPARKPSRICEASGRRIHCNPREDNGVPDILLENLGNGQFRDQSDQSGISEFSEYGLGVMICDLDANGTLEIFVANDGNRNLLFDQVAVLKYEERALTAGIAFNGEGETMGSMGIACADFNADNHLDLLTTNFAFERNVLFSGLGNLSFIDESRGTDIDMNSRNYVGWSAVPLDANLDGQIDLFVTNGHVTDMPDQDFQQQPILMEGTQRGLRHIDTAGDYFLKKWHGRGACRADLNSDGHTDMVVCHIDSPASLLINSTQDENNFISIQLIGTQSSRAAEAVRVNVETASGIQTFLYGRNGGYLSSHSDLLTVGLGAEDTVSNIRVFWPGGEQQIVRDVAANSIVRIIEQRPGAIE